jgi:hypothetical protein
MGRMQPAPFGYEDDSDREFADQEFEDAYMEWRRTFDAAGGSAEAPLSGESHAPPSIPEPSVGGGAPASTRRSSQSRAVRGGGSAGGQEPPGVPAATVTVPTAELNLLRAVAAHAPGSEAEWDWWKDSLIP